MAVRRGHQRAPVACSPRFVTVCAGAWGYLLLYGDAFQVRVSSVGPAAAAAVLFARSQKQCSGQYGSGAGLCTGSAGRVLICAGRVL
jgi:hypothetical protein